MAMIHRALEIVERGSAPTTSGVVFEVQRWSIHDGPGVRTAVFLKGCPLQCQWCCNPESQSKDPQIAVFPDRCIACGNCIDACPNKVSILPSQGGVRDRELCTQCGKCVEVCPAEAKQWSGREMTVEEVMDIIRRDMAFYRRSGGGVTLSGGEPLSQPSFVRHLMDISRSLGIDTAIETCGHFKWEKCQDILKMADLVFLDIKHLDPAIHMKLTGASNEIILQNAIKMAEEETTLIVRVPVVPSLNDGPENIRATAEFVRRYLPNVKEIELLPYHGLGKMKYSALGLRYDLEHIRPPKEEKMAQLRAIIAETDVDKPRLL